MMFNTENWAAVPQAPEGGVWNVFISQPMRDLSPEEIEAKREAVMGYLPKFLNAECKEIESYFGTSAEHRPPTQCLGESIVMMSGADVVVFAKGWQDARGCRIEHQVASEYGFPILEEV